MRAYITEKIWEDPDFIELNDLEKLCVFYFLTKANTLGFVEITPNKFRRDIAAPFEIVEGACKGLGRGFVRTSKGVWIRNFIRYQFGDGERLARSNMRSTLCKQLKSMCDEVNALVTEEYPVLREKEEAPAQKLGLKNKPLGSCAEAPSKGQGEGEGEGEGGNGRGTGETDPEPNGNHMVLGGEFIADVEQAMAQLVTVGVPADFGRYIFDDWESRGGKDGSGVRVRWPNYAKKRWSRECREWQAKTHKGNRPAGVNGHGKPTVRERETERTGIEYKGVLRIAKPKAAPETDKS